MATERGAKLQPSETSYRVYQVDMDGRRVEHNLHGERRGNACQSALAFQEEAGWPTIEVWGGAGQLTCEDCPTDIIPSAAERMADPDASGEGRSK
jgi:hypothetical protein